MARTRLNTRHFAAMHEAVIERRTGHRRPFYRRWPTRLYWRFKYGS